VSALLEIRDLRLHYRTTRGIARAVDGVELTVQRNEALVVLGESGCGKTSLTRALLRLLPRNVADYGGSVMLDGIDVMSLSDREFRRTVPWRRISVVMQAAMNAMNPVIRVGEQVAEPLRMHLGYTRRAALQRAAETFAMVGLPVEFLMRYPFELSGGMRQRAVIAMALVTEPPLVILDEPTSALDVLTQAAIMNLLKRIKRELGTSFILITHDVATSSEIADRVALMYAGQLVETAPASEFFTGPAHPYAQLLMDSVPRLRGTTAPTFIPGQPPNLLNLPRGCRFAARCPSRFDACEQQPPLFSCADGQASRCWLQAPEAATETAS
jgi:peptide/nickel transport system ATP-binding protein